MTTSNHATMPVAVKVVVSDPCNRILVLRVAGSAGDEEHAYAKGLWDLPGGRMEEGEDPLDALKREVKQELGFDVDPGWARCFHAETYKIGSSEARETVLMLFYQLSVSEAVDITLSEEHDASQWVDLHDIPQVVQTTLGKYLGIYQHHF